MFRFVAIGAVSFALMSSFSAWAAAPPPIARADEDNLTRPFAELRKSQISKVHYDLHFGLKKGQETFDVSTVIDVDLKRTDLPLSIDLKTDKIISVRVNGEEVKDYVTRNGSFDLPIRYLKPSLKIEVQSSSAYNKEGEGFQRSIDPEDKSEYVFSDFEPNYSHTLFPCFDQPDLKATFHVVVDAPKDWLVIGNVLPEKSETKSGMTTTTFHETPLFSTYLFFLAAGPFVEFKDQEGDIPLFIHVRKTLAQYVDAPRLFDVTKKGLRFYGDYFGRPYPFPKYGQIFIPEFAWGGMENVGAVALNEKDIFRGSVSQATLEGRDDLILHEMAHMWFGDLVTMKWWNDLWLNESFATYMASLAQDRAMHAKGVWLDFFSEKTWGYWQDQLVTTHPIETTVPDVRTAKGNFDGITYAKGAATLKQLHFFVGEDGFRDGVRNYFKKFASSNTERADFIGEIQAASKRDLKSWTHDWLQTAGPNRVEAAWTCRAGKIATFSILQKPSVSKTLSPHRMRVSLLKAPESGAFDVLKSIDVTYTKKSTAVAAAKGAPCPDFVFANQDDQDYALFSLDQISLQKAKAALTGRASDPLTRVMIWNMLAQMVRDLHLPVREYFEIALPSLESEKEDSVLAIIAGRHSSISNYYQAYLTPEQRIELAPRFEAMVAGRLDQAEAKSNTQMTFFDFFCEIAKTPASLARLKGFLKGDKLPKGLVIDQDRRWRIISALASEGAEGSESIIDNELKRDKTTAGERNGYASKAALPTAEAKKKYWDAFQTPEKIPYSTLRAAAGSFHSVDHADLAVPYVHPLLEKVSTINWTDNDNLIEIYFERLFPQNICSKDLLMESRAALAKAKNLTDLARRGWLEANDELEHCIGIRALSVNRP